MRNSIEASRTASRRPSVGPQDVTDRNPESMFTTTDDHEAVQGDPIAPLFQDNWDWGFDSSMPTYGSFGFEDNSIFLPPS